MNDGQSKVKMISGVLIGLSLIGLFTNKFSFWSILGLIFTATLCYFLMQRKEWARITLAVLIIIGAVFGVLGIFVLLFVAPLLAIWGIINIGINIYIAYLLLLDNSVKQYFSTATYQ